MGKATKRKLLLIRSGPTEWDLAGRLQGQADLPLAPGHPGPDLTPLFQHDGGGASIASVHAGPDEACRFLAQKLHDLAESKVNIVEDLRELDLGLWSGLRRDELEKRFERAGTQWLDDPASVSPPGGETIADLESRLVPVIEKAISRRRTATNIAVVLRPVAYACLRCRLEQAPTTTMREYFEDPTPPPPIWFEIVRDDPRLVLAPAPTREADRQVPAA